MELAPHSLLPPLLSARSVCSVPQPPRHSNPEQPSVWKPRPATPTRRSAALREATETGPSGPTPQGLAVQGLEWLAIGPRHGQAGYRDRLAPPRLPVVLDMESSSREEWTATAPQRRSGSDSLEEPGEPLWGAPRIVPAPALTNRETPVQRRLVEHDHVIQALAADCPDYAFHVNPLPWGPVCREHLFDAYGIHICAERAAEDPISVTEQDLRDLIEVKLQTCFFRA